MRFRRPIRFPGLLMVLLALSAQLALSSRVPRQDPLSVATAFCHATDTVNGSPDHAPPPHSIDCLLCPFCVALHASALVTPEHVAVPTPVIRVVLRPELPPPSTAPPRPRGFISQSRAPPTVS